MSFRSIEKSRFGARLLVLRLQLEEMRDRKQDRLLYARFAGVRQTRSDRGERRHLDDRSPIRHDFDRTPQTDFAQHPVSPLFGR